MNPIEELIRKDGIQHATDRFADIISSKINNKDLAKQFILEEVEAASQGDDTAREFADAIIRLYQDEALWNTISVASQENVSRHFSPQCAINNLEALLTDLKPG